MNELTALFFIGIGATAVTDLWSVVRKYLLGIAFPNYGLVGRWIAHMPRGRFYHTAISASPAIKNEALIGWTVHYLIGISFSGLLIVIGGWEWLQQPSLGPAIGVGVVTVAAPYLLMQPGMGAGIAAAKTPNPNSARLQSLITHLVFGFGLYSAGVVCNSINDFLFATV